ncbi:unnamed protein product [Rhizoctonia solani]|uniref:Uncharacterized protein n=1 Tax=Rhizoctonia solani TaxID=456999 RepID=A0A8H3E9J0_9AGAM|nr:unnamed protein product [Rhizoctonia solani]
MWTKISLMGMLPHSPVHRQTPTTLTTKAIMGLLLVNNNGPNHIPIHSKVNPGSINNLGTASRLTPEDNTGLACDVIFHLGFSMLARVELGLIMTFVMYN